jgi:putative oxidoreductase
MMNSAATIEPGQAFSPIAAYKRILSLADRIPLSIVQFASRVAIAHVFWSSAQSKLASWPITIQLFAMEYRIPVLPPDVAAFLGTAAELTGSVLVFLGLFTRFGALILLGVVTMIQTLVYPGHWAEHLLWASLLGLLLARGAGMISLDYIAKHLFTRSM